MLLLLLACGDRWDPDASQDTGDTAASPSELVVPLRWVRGYDGDDWDQARAGMWWQLGALGALPPADEQAISVVSDSADEVLFSLDLGAVGFPEAALPGVTDAVAFVEDTDEVALTGGLDLGAFFLRTLYEPWWYYTITGACGTWQQWAADQLAHEPARYAIVDSMLVEGDRLDRYTPRPSTVDVIAHLVEEGEGSLADGTFVPLESESIDLLPNGMLRFAVYDTDGPLQPWGLASPAGQPGRCMWCHEDHLQRGLETNPSAEGYVPASEFVAEIDAQTDAIAVLRRGLSTALTFDPPDAHEDGELLTETWLLPSPGRLAREWAMPEADVRAALATAAVPTVTNPEYPEFGDLVSRVDAERVFAGLLPDLADDLDHPFHGWEEPFVPVSTSASAREPQDAPLAWGDPEDLRCE